MEGSRKKWLGMAAVGAAIATFVARISRRGDREAAPQANVAPPEADS